MSKQIVLNAYVQILLVSDIFSVGKRATIVIVLNKNTMYKYFFWIALRISKRRFFQLLNLLKWCTFRQTNGRVKVRAYHFYKLALQIFNVVCIETVSENKFILYSILISYKKFFVPIRYMHVLLVISSYWTNLRALASFSKWLQYCAETLCVCVCSMLLW